jgi:hypothetical protein
VREIVDIMEGILMIIVMQIILLYEECACGARSLPREWHRVLGSRMVFCIRVFGWPLIQHDQRETFDSPSRSDWQDCRKDGGSDLVVRQTPLEAYTKFRSSLSKSFANSPADRSYSRTVDKKRAVEKSSM